ncbi:MAG: hypothetical protein J1F31_06645 [Erysipelotrichales bacterium]|nr:hypothetical protein [Erysipelotrichales bacterium]
MKLIRDIRVFIYDKHINNFFGARSFSAKKINIAVTRLAKLLATKKFYTNGDYDHIYLIFRESREDFNVLENNTKLERELNWIKMFYVEIPKKQFSNLDNENNIMEFYELLRKILSYIFPFYQKIIDSSIELLIDYGEKAEIEYKSKNNEKIHVNLKYQLLDNSMFLPIIVVCSKNGNVIRRLEMDKTNELGMFGNIRINKNKIIITPKNGIYYKRFSSIEIEI